MEQLVAHLIQYGLLVVFANVFLEQIGVPIPALPTLVVAGALAARGRMDPVALLAVALAASVLADTVWYYIGRWQGHRVLRTVCKLSLSPDSCVRGTEDLFERAGMPSLLYAKFIPGYNTIAPPLAGAMSKSLGSFVFWDTLGSLLWIGSGVVIGFIFHRAVGRALHYLETLGYWAGGVLAVGLALVVLVKWWQRKRVSNLLHLRPRAQADDGRGRDPDDRGCPQPLRPSPRPAAHPRGPAGDGRRGRREARASAPGPRDRRLLHVTERSLRGPCGSRSDGKGIHEGPPPRRGA
jgi:membrane protein DedA with SNARE-associated domain